MARIILFAAVMLMTAPAHAQVYKCKEGGKTVFSDTPCHADAAPVDLKPASGGYNELDGLRAQSRALTDKSELMRIENEREWNGRGATIKSERQRKTESDRCLQVRKDKAEAQHLASTYRYPENIRREQEKAKYWEEREFFECQ